MVGLSKHAAEFFKFLLIIVEFSLAMTLFVSTDFPITSIPLQSGVHPVS